MIVGGGREWLWEEGENGCGRTERMDGEEGENSYRRRERMFLGRGREWLWQESWVVWEEGDNIIIG
jgi:hypothetical protein